MMNISAGAQVAINNFHAVDYAVFGVLLTLSVLIGVYFGFFDGTEQTTEEYLLGGRRMRPIPVAISLVASQLSAYSIISVPSETFSFGSTYTIMVVPCVIVMTLLVNYGIFPVFYHGNFDNCYTYLDLRFGRTVRQFTTFLFIFAVLLFLPIASFLPAFAFAQITGLNLHMINAVVSAVCVAYTVMGGVKAVIWTDVVQATVMVFSICTVLVCAVMRVGGLRETLIAAIEGGRLAVPSTSFDLRTRQTVWNMSVGLVFMWLAHVGFNQSCVQRLSSLPSLRDARKAMFIFCGGVLLVKVTTGAIGVALYAFYKDCDPVVAGVVDKADKLMPLFVNEVVGHITGMPGVFISCVFSASLSTASAYFNSVAGIVYKEYVCAWSGYEHTERKASVIMRIIIGAMGVYCICMGFLVEKSTSLFQVQYTVTSLTSGVVVGVFSLAMFYPWASQRAVLWGAMASMGLMSWLIVGAQLVDYVYAPLPSSIAGCTAENTTSSFSLLTTTVESTSAILQAALSAETFSDVPFSIYHISFQWYPLIGTCSVWLVAILLSHTIAPNTRPVETTLISPLVRLFWPQTKQRHTEMQVIDPHFGQTEMPITVRTVVTETVYAVREK